MCIHDQIGASLYLHSSERRNMEERLTDKQFEKILKMVAMILDGCKDLDEAKAKVAELLEKEKPAE